MWVRQHSLSRVHLVYDPFIGTRPFINMACQVPLLLLLLLLLLYFKELIFNTQLFGDDQFITSDTEDNLQKAVYLL